jgi:hypothetical protein
MKTFWTLTKCILIGLVCYLNPFNSFYCDWMLDDEDD